MNEFDLFTQDSQPDPFVVGVDLDSLMGETFDNFEEGEDDECQA